MNLLPTNLRDVTDGVKKDAAIYAAQEQARNLDAELLKEFKNIRAKLLADSHIDHRINCVISKNGVNLGSVRKFYTVA